MVQTSLTSLEREPCDTSPFGILSNLLSVSQQNILKQSLHEKVSPEELKNIAQSVVIWVVSTVISILYPAISMYEERLRTKVYTISDESFLSSVDNTISSPQSEESSKISESHPLCTSRKVGFTHSDLKHQARAMEKMVHSIATPSLDMAITESSRSTDMSGSECAVPHLQQDRSLKTLRVPVMDLKLDVPSDILESGAIELQHELKEKEIKMHDSKSNIASGKQGKVTCSTRFSPTLPTHKELAAESDDAIVDQPNLDQIDKSLSERDNISKVFQDLKFYLTDTAEDILGVVFQKITGDISGPIINETEYPVCHVQPSTNIETTFKVHPAGPLSDITEKTALENFKAKLEVISTAEDIVDNILDKLQSVVEEEYTGLLTKDYLGATNQSEYIELYKKFLTEMSEKPSCVPESADEIVQLVLGKLEDFATVKKELINEIEPSTETCLSKESNNAEMIATIESTAAAETVHSDFAKQVVKEEIQKSALKVDSSHSKVYLHVEELISSVLNFIVSDLDGSIVDEAPHSKVCHSEKGSSLSGFVKDILYDMDSGTCKDTDKAGKLQNSELEMVDGTPDGQKSILPFTPCKLPKMQERHRMTILPANVPGMVIYSEEEHEDIGAVSKCKLHSSVTKQSDNKTTLSHEKYDCFGQNSRKLSIFHKKPSTSETEFIGEITETNKQIIKAKDCFLAELGKHHWLPNRQEEICQLLKATEDVISEMLSQIMKDMCNYLPAVDNKEWLIFYQKSELSESCVKWQNEMINNSLVSVSDASLLVHDIVESLLKILHVATTNETTSSHTKREDAIQLLFQGKDSAGVIGELSKSTIYAKCRPFPELTPEGYAGICTLAPNYLQESKINVSTSKELVISEQIIQMILTKLEKFVNVKVKSYFFHEVHSENIQQRQANEDQNEIPITIVENPVTSDQLPELNAYAQKVASTLLSIISNTLDITNYQQSPIAKTPEVMNVYATKDPVMRHLPNKGAASLMACKQEKTTGLNASISLHNDRSFISMFVNCVLEIITNENYKVHSTSYDHQGMSTPSQECTAGECIIHRIFNEVLREGSEKTKNWMLRNVGEIVQDMFLRIMTSVEHPFYVTYFSTYSRKPTKICSEPYLLKNTEILTEFPHVNNELLQSDIDFVSKEIVKDVFETLCSAVLACKETIKANDLTLLVDMHKAGVVTSVKEREVIDDSSTQERNVLSEKGQTGGQERSVGQMKHLDVKPTTHLSLSDCPRIAEDIVKTVLYRLEGFAISKLNCFYPTNKRKSLSEVAFPTEDQVKVCLTLQDGRLNRFDHTSAKPTHEVDDKNDNISGYLSKSTYFPQMNIHKTPLHSKLYVNAKKVSHFILKVIQDKLEGSTQSIVLGIINSFEGKRTIKNLVDSVLQNVAAETFNETTSGITKDSENTEPIFHMNADSSKVPIAIMSTSIQGQILEKSFRKIEADIKNQQTSQIINFVQRILSEFFHGMLIDLLLLPLPLTHPSKTSRSYKQLVSDAFIKLNDETQGALVSESELTVVTDGILRIIFQKLHSAIVASSGIYETNLSREPSDLSTTGDLITDEVLALISSPDVMPNENTHKYEAFHDDIQTDNLVCSEVLKPSKEICLKEETDFFSQKITAGATSTTFDISEDIVKTVFRELTHYATSKVESLFCPEDQPQSKPLMSTTFSASHEELKDQKMKLSPKEISQALTAKSSESLVNLNVSSSNIKTWKLKKSSKGNLAYAKLHAYAKEVANTILQDIMHKLGKDVQTILSPSSISSFHENIITSRVLNSILEFLSCNCKYTENECDKQLAKSHITDKELDDVHDLVSAAIKQSYLITSDKCAVLAKGKVTDVESEQHVMEYAGKKSRGNAVHHRAETTWPANHSSNLNPHHGIIKEGFLGRILQRNPDFSENEKSILHSAVEDLLNAMFKQLIADIHCLSRSFSHQRKHDVSAQQHEYVLPLSKNVCKSITMLSSQMPISKSDVTFFSSDMVDLVLQKVQYAVSTEQAGLTRKKILCEFFQVHDIKEKDRTKFITSLFEIKHSDPQSSSPSTDTVLEDSGTDMQQSSFAKQQSKAPLTKTQHCSEEEVSIIIEDVIKSIITKLETFVVYKLESLLNIENTNKKTKEKTNKATHVHRHKSSGISADRCQNSISIIKSEVKSAVSSMMLSRVKEVKHYAAEIANLILNILKSRLDKEIAHVVSWVNSSSLYEHFATAKIVDTVLYNVIFDTKSKTSVDVETIFSQHDLTDVPNSPFEKPTDQTDLVLPESCPFVLPEPSVESPFLEVKERESLDSAENKQATLTENDRPFSEPQSYILQESVLEKMIGKKNEYKEELEVQIVDFVESVLNDMCQRVMGEFDHDQPFPELIPANMQDPPKEMHASKAINDKAEKTMQRSLLSQSEIDIFAHDMVDIVLENVSSAIIAGVLAKGSSPCVEHQLPSAEICQDSLEDLFPSEFNVAAERIIKTVFMRLESFATLKLDTTSSSDNLGRHKLMAASDITDTNQVQNTQYSMNQRMQNATHQQTLSSSLKEPNVKISIYKPFGEEDEGISTIHMSQNMLNTYAEKLTSSVLRVIKKDLDQEVQHIYSGVNISLEQNVTANEIVDNILEALSDEKFNKCAVITVIGPHGRVLANEGMYEIPDTCFMKSTLTCVPGYPEISSEISNKSQLLNTVEDVLNEVHQRIMMDVGHLPHSLLYFNKDQLPEENQADVALAATTSKSLVQSAANDIVETVLQKVYWVINENESTSRGTQTGAEHMYDKEDILTTAKQCLNEPVETDNREEDNMLVRKPARKLYFTSNSNAQQITDTLSSLQLAGERVSSAHFASISGELVQTVMAKIASFAVPKLEPLSRSEIHLEDIPECKLSVFNVQQNNKSEHMHKAQFQMFSNDASYNISEPKVEVMLSDFKLDKELLVISGSTQVEDYESDLSQTRLSKEELELYAKDVITHILGIIKHEMNKDNFQRRAFSDYSLHFNETSKANNIVDTILKELCCEYRDLIASQKDARSFKKLRLPTDQTLSVADSFPIVNNLTDMNERVCDTDYETKYSLQSRMAERIFQMPRQLSDADLQFEAPTVPYHLVETAITKPEFNIELQKEFRQESEPVLKDVYDISSSMHIESGQIDNSTCKLEDIIPIEEMFSHSPVHHEENLTENEKHSMLHIAENVVSAVLQKIQSLEQSVSLLSFFKEPSFQEISNKFIYNFPPVDVAGESLSDVSDADSVFKSETKLVASEIVETVLEKLYFCFKSNVPMESLKEDSDNITDQNSVRSAVEAYLQEQINLDESASSNSSSMAELLHYNYNNNKTIRDYKQNDASSYFLSSSASLLELRYCNFNNNRSGNVRSDVDRFAIDTIESVLSKLHSFVGFQLNLFSNSHLSVTIKHSNQCISSLEKTESTKAFSTKVNSFEKLPSMKIGHRYKFTNNPATKSVGVNDACVVQRENSTIKKDGMEEVRHLHSEMNTYATVIVSCILTKIKKEIEKEIRQDDVSPLSSISENIVAGEIINDILKICSSYYNTVITDMKDQKVFPNAFLDMADIGKSAFQDVGITDHVRMITNKLLAHQNRSQPLYVPGIISDSGEECKYQGSDSSGQSPSFAFNLSSQPDLGSRKFTLDSPTPWLSSPRIHTYDIPMNMFAINYSAHDSVHHCPEEVLFTEDMQQQKQLLPHCFTSINNSVEIDRICEPQNLPEPVSETHPFSQIDSKDCVKDDISSTTTSYFLHGCRHNPRSERYSVEKSGKQKGFPSEHFLLTLEEDRQPKPHITVEMSVSNDLPSTPSSCNRCLLDMVSINNNKSNNCNFTQGNLANQFTGTVLYSEEDGTKQLPVHTEQVPSFLKIVDFHCRPMADKPPKCTPDIIKSHPSSSRGYACVMSPLQSSELDLDSNFTPRAECYIELNRENRSDIITKCTSETVMQLDTPHKQSMITKSVCTLVTPSAPSFHDYAHDISSISFGVNVDTNNPESRESRGKMIYPLEDDPSLVVRILELEDKPSPTIVKITSQGSVTTNSTCKSNVHNMFASSALLKLRKKDFDPQNAPEKLLSKKEEEHFEECAFCEYPSSALASIEIDNHSESNIIANSSFDTSSSKPSLSGRYMHTSPVLGSGKHSYDSQCDTAKVHFTKVEKRKELDLHGHHSSKLNRSPIKDLITNSTSSIETLKPSPFKSNIKDVVSSSTNSDSFKYSDVFKPFSQSIHCLKSEEEHAYVSKTVPSASALHELETQTKRGNVEKCVTEKINASPLPCRSFVSDISLTTPYILSGRHKCLPKQFREHVLQKKKIKHDTMLNKEPLHVYTILELDNKLKPEIIAKSIPENATPLSNRFSNDMFAKFPNSCSWKVLSEEQSEQQEVIKSENFSTNARHSDYCTYPKSENICGLAVGTPTSYPSSSKSYVHAVSCSKQCSKQRSDGINKESFSKLISKSAMHSKVERDLQTIKGTPGNAPSEDKTNDISKVDITGKDTLCELGKVPCSGTETEEEVECKINHLKLSTPDILTTTASSSLRYIYNMSPSISSSQCTEQDSVSKHVSEVIFNSESEINKTKATLLYHLSPGVPVSKRNFFEKDNITKKALSLPTLSRNYTQGRNSSATCLDVVQQDCFLKDLYGNLMYTEGDKHKDDQADQISSFLRSLTLQSQIKKEISGSASDTSFPQVTYCTCTANICDDFQERAQSDLWKHQCSFSKMYTKEECTEMPRTIIELTGADPDTNLTESNARRSEYLAKEKVEKDRMTSQVMDQDVVFRATVSPVKINMTAETIVDTVLYNFENHLSFNMEQNDTNLNSDVPLKKTFDCNGLHPSEILLLANKIATSVLQQVILLKTRGVCENETSTTSGSSEKKRATELDSDCTPKGHLKEFDPSGKEGSAPVTNASTDDLTSTILYNVFCNVHVLKEDCNMFSSRDKEKASENINPAERLLRNSSLIHPYYKTETQSSLSANTEYISLNVSKAIIRILLDRQILEEYFQGNILPDQEKKYIFRQDNFSHDYDKISYQLVNTVVDMLYRNINVLPHVNTSEEMFEIPKIHQMKMEGATASRGNEVASLEKTTDIDDLPADLEHKSQNKLQKNSELIPEIRSAFTKFNCTDFYETKQMLESYQLEAVGLRNEQQCNSEIKVKPIQTKINSQYHCSRPETPMNCNTQMYTAISTCTSQNARNHKMDACNTETALLSFLASDDGAKSPSKEADSSDSLYQNLTCSDSKEMVEKVFNIIVDSFLSDKSCSSDIGLVNVATREHMSSAVSPCQNPTPHKAHHVSSALSILGFSEPSVTLLKTVSEKLVRKMLQKCLFTSQICSCDPSNINSPQISEGKSQWSNTLQREDKNILVNEVRNSVLDDFSRTLGNSVMDILYHNLEQPSKELTIDINTSSNARTTESTCETLAIQTFNKDKEKNNICDSNGTLPALNHTESNPEHDILLGSGLEWKEGTSENFRDTSRIISETKQTKYPVTSGITTEQKYSTLKAETLHGVNTSKPKDNITKTEVPKKMDCCSSSKNTFKEGVKESYFSIVQQKLDSCNFHIDSAVSGTQQSGMQTTLPSDMHFRELKTNVCCELLSCLRIGVLSNSFLKDIKTKLLAKMFNISYFPVSEDVKYTATESFCERVTKLMNGVMSNIIKRQTALEHGAKEDKYFQPSGNDLNYFIDTIYGKILCQSGSQLALYRDIADKNSVIAERLAILIIADISNYQCYNTNGSPVTFSIWEMKDIILQIINCINLTCKQRQTSIIIENILIRFFRKVFKVPITNLQPERSEIPPYNEPIGAFVNSVILEISHKSASITNAATVEHNFHEVNDLIEKIVNTVYSSILLITGTTKDVLIQDILSNDYKRAKELSELIFAEIYTYHLESYFCGQTPSTLYINVNSGHIVQNILSNAAMDRKPTQTCELELTHSEETDSYLCKRRTIYQIDQIAKCKKYSIQSARVFPVTFLEDILICLLPKILSFYYENAEYMESRTVSENDITVILVRLIKELLIEFAEKQIVLSNDAQKEYYSPQINDVAVDKVVNTVYDIFLHRYGSEIVMDKLNECLCDKLACCIVLEMSTYHLQHCLSNDVSWYTPSVLESNNIIKHVLNNLHVLTAQRQPSVSYVCMVPKEFLQTIVTKLLSKLINISDSKTDCTENIGCLSDDSTVLEKVSHAVMMELFKYHIWVVTNSDVVWCSQGNDVVVKQIVDAAYTILKTCRCQNTMQKSIRILSPFLIETIASSIIKNIFSILMDSLSDGEIIPPIYRNTNLNAIVRDFNDTSISRNKSQQSPTNTILYPVKCLEETNLCISYKSMLSFTILEDVITKCVSKIISPVSDLPERLMCQLVIDFSKQDILVTKDVNVKHGLYSNKDIENISDTIFHRILDVSGSTMPMRTPSQFYVNNLSSIIVSEMTTNYLNLFIPKAQSISPATSAYYPQNKSNKLFSTNPKTQQFLKYASSDTTKFLEEVISGLLLKLLPTTSKTEVELNEMINALLDSILVGISGAHVMASYQEEECSHLVTTKNVNNVVEAIFSEILQEYGPNEFTMVKICNENLPRKISSLLMRLIFDSKCEPCVSRDWARYVYIDLRRDNIVQNLKCKISKNENIEQQSIPTTHVLSFIVLEDIIRRLLSQIFSPFPSLASHTGKGRLSESAFNETVTRLMSKLEIEFFKHHICVKRDTKESQSFSPKDVEHVVNSVYSEIKETVGSQLALQNAIETENNVFDDYILSLIVTETSQYLIYTLVSRENSFYTSTPVSDVVSPCDTDSGVILTSEKPKAIPALGDVYSVTFLGDLIAGILSHILQTFTDVKNANYRFRPGDEVSEMTKTIIHSVLMEITAANIKVMNIKEYVQPVDEQIVKQIVHSVATNVLEEFGSQVVDHKKILTDERFSKRIVGLILDAISNYQLDISCSISYPQSFSSLEEDNLVIKVQKNICMQCHSLCKSMFTLSPHLFENIITKLLLKFLILPCYTTCTETSSILSKTTLSEIITVMITSLCTEMFQLPANYTSVEELYYPPEDDNDLIDALVDCTYNTALKDYGSPFQLYGHITSTYFLQTISKLIAKEISCYQCCLFSGNLFDLFTRIKHDNIIERIFSNVPAHLLTGLAEKCVSESTEDIIPVRHEHRYLGQIGDTLSKITPYIKNKPMKIDPFIVSEHLGVISIKTEPLETLKRHCLNSTGLSLADVRKASISGTNVQLVTSSKSTLHPDSDLNRKERRSLLDESGRLNVRPREVVCRNSFLNLVNPDITKVELLKDVQSKQDLINRLVAHDIDQGLKEVDGNEEDGIDEEEFTNERILKEDNCFLTQSLIPTELGDAKKKTFTTLTEMSNPDLENYFQRKLFSHQDRIEDQDQHEDPATSFDIARRNILEQKKVPCEDIATVSSSTFPQLKSSVCGKLSSAFNRVFTKKLSKKK
ncbi:fibrous sheath-interacting protein 2-like [Ambystoma mexicanum]|uniref:fibrous sheath-interacting protein 2-like n=1 Tax=Ambystoma mexicanum TaxID=8296 RepID=UPI0037E830C5